MKPVSSDHPQGLRTVGLWIVLAMIVWIFAFRHFLFGGLVLLEDAIPYYHHIKYFLTYLGEGVYPLWSPDWSCGAGNEFFLRRMGSYNPFLLILLAIYKIGVPFSAAYRIYLVLYYFTGALGFYAAAHQLLRNQSASYLAFLLFLFSAIGTRIFDSYILLTAVPAIWFFFFLISFHQHPSRRAMLGMTFTLMIILTTYIPFYFLTGVILFVISIAVLNPRQIGEFLGRLWEFFRRRPGFTAFCAGIFLVSMIPGLMLFRHGGGGEMVMPGRHAQTAEHTEKNVLSVDAKTITDWALPEELMYSSFFNTDLRRLVFATCYIPFFAYILFFLGAFTRLSRMTIFFVLWGLCFLIISMPHATPIYFFLNEHIFFFKYFRNLHFFLWIYLLPIFFLMISGQFRQIITEEPRSKFWLALTGGVHAGYGLYMLLYEKQIITTYLALAMSCIFFLWYFRRGTLFPGKGPTAAAIALLVLVSLQPLETYSYLRGNSEQTTDIYPYDYASREFTFTTLKGKSADIYYGSPWYHFLLQNVNYQVVMEYLYPKLLLYDRVEWVDEAKLKEEAALIAEAKENEEKLDTQGFSLKRIEAALALRKNIAFVVDDSAVKEMPPEAEKAADQYLIVTGNSKVFEVLDYHANGVRFKTNFRSPKFLVYHDNFHSGWRGAINGQPLKIYRANLSFKGMWLPAGKNTVELRFEDRGKYIFNFSLLGLFAAVFIWLIVLWRPGAERQGD